MENKKSDLTNTLTSEEARAEDLSGLLPVIEELKNGVDIQPLDDVEDSEIIPFEDRCVINNGYDEEMLRNSERKKRIIKRIVRCLIVIIVAGALLASAYNVFLKLNDYSHPAVAVYQKDDCVEVLLDNNKTVKIDDVIEAKISADGSYLAYSEESSQKTGKLDIRLVELKKRSSVKNKGTVAVCGAEDDWRMSKNGTYIYYSVTEEKNKHYYAYSAESKKAESVVSSADEVFLPPDGDIVYFTRKGEKKTKLFRTRVGEKAKEVADADGIKGFSDENSLEIIYTVSNSDNLIDIYRVTQETEPVEIAKGVSEVFLEDYQSGGNLYYFIKNDSNFDWNDYITDNYAESDSKLKKPDKDDYSITVGWIFKRKKLDESAYNSAMQKYNQKLLRDSIREALDEYEFNSKLSSDYKIKVFSSEGNKELAGGVKTDDLISYTKTGLPKILIQKNGIDLSKKISINDLFVTAKNSSPVEAVEKAFSSLENSGYRVVNGYKYVFYNGTNVYQYDFSPDFNVKEASILFGSKNSIFTAVKESGDNTNYKIYYCRVETDGFSEPKEISDKVVSFEIYNEGLYFETESSGVNNTLYFCNVDGSKVKVTDNLAEYKVNSDGSVFVFTAKEDKSVIEKADLLLFRNNSTKEIEKNIYYKNYIFKDGKIAYIKDYKTSDSGKGGNMIIYSGDNKKSVEGTVRKIFDIN